MGNQPYRKLISKRPVTPAMLDDFPDQIQIPLKFAFHVFTHETTALTQLDLEAGSEVRLHLEPRQVHAYETFEARSAIFLFHDGCVKPQIDIMHLRLENRNEKVFLILEVQVYRSGRDSRFTRYLGDLGLKEALMGKYLDGRVEDPEAFVVCFEAHGKSPENGSKSYNGPIEFEWKAQRIFERQMRKERPQERRDGNRSLGVAPWRLRRTSGFYNE